MESNAIFNGRMTLSNRCDHFCSGAGFQQIAGRSAAECFGRNISVGVHGQENHLDVRNDFLDLLACLQTIENGHGESYEPQTIARDFEHRILIFLYVESSDAFVNWQFCQFSGDAFPEEDPWA
jgi:hypothetical protein